MSSHDGRFRALLCILVCLCMNMITTLRMLALHLACSLSNFFENPFTFLLDTNIRLVK